MSVARCHDDNREWSDHCVLRSSVREEISSSSAGPQPSLCPHSPLPALPHLVAAPLRRAAVGRAAIFSASITSSPHRAFAVDVAVDIAAAVVAYSVCTLRRGGTRSTKVSTLLNSDRKSKLPPSSPLQMTSPAWTGASLRNRGPILAQLLRLAIPAALPHALEIGTGQGAHLSLNAPALPHLTWHPTDLGSPSVASEALASPNVRAPQPLDASAAYGAWPKAVRSRARRFGLVLCVNVVHISPWEVTLGLFRGARETVGDGGWVVLYGPFFEEHVAVAEGNVQFDAVLRGRDVRWGVRRLEDVVEVAEREGFEVGKREEMPANNLFVAFRKRTTVREG